MSVPGARIASIVVGRPELFKEWNEEMEYMSGRIKVPHIVHIAACSACASRDCPFAACLSSKECIKSAANLSLRAHERQRR